MTTKQNAQTLADNDSERKSTIRASRSVIDDFVITTNALSALLGKPLATNEDRLIGMIEFVRLNMRAVSQ